MKFKLDENVPLHLRRVIEEAGHQACDVYEQSLSGKPDAIIFERCRYEQYILITQDSDFENSYLYPPNTHPGIIVLRLKNQGINIVLKTFKIFLEKVNLHKIKNAITIITSDKIKIRK